MAEYHIYAGNICEGIGIIKLHDHAKTPCTREAIFFFNTENKYFARICSLDDRIRFMALKYFFTATINKA